MNCRTVHEPGPSLSASDARHGLPAWTRYPRPSLARSGPLQAAPCPADPGDPPCAEALAGDSSHKAEGIFRKHKQSLIEDKNEEL